MIINGGAAGNVGWWGKHLQRDDTNDRAEVMEISGLLADDLPGALHEMQAIAAQSRSGGNFMYQANLNPRDNETLTPEQWREAVDTLEKNLGMEGHQRVVVEHEKDGRTHRHVIWNRVDVETLRVTDIGGNYYTHERTARDLEQKFDLAPTQSLHGERRPDGRPERAPELWEERAAERSGIDPATVKADLSELWRRTDSGKSFAAALTDRGYILAQGDRRDFCAVDAAGDAHSLARRIEGAKAKDIRERMADVDRVTLPTVDEARETQRSRPQEARTPAPQPAPQEQAQQKVEAREPIRPIAQAEPTRRSTPTTQPTIDRPREEPKPQLQQQTKEPEQAKAAPQPFTVSPYFKQQPIPHVTQTVPEAKPKAQEPQPTPATPAATLTPAEAKVQEAWRGKRDVEVARVKDAPKAAPPPARGDLQVVDAAGRVAESLGNFVLSLFGGSSPPKPQPEQDSVDQLIAQRKALAALGNIRDSMKRGDGLNEQDVRNLTPEHLLNIRERGDDYMRELIDRMERSRERERDRGRERER